MAVVARTATTVTHKTAVTVPASPGTAANTPDGDTFPNGGNSILVMNNTGASSRTVDVYTTSSVDGLPVQTRQFTVAAGVIQYVKLGPPGLYGTVTKVIASHSEVKLAVYAL